MSKNKFRNRFSVREAKPHVDPGISMTVQSEAKAADINHIVSRHLGPGRSFKGVPQLPGASRAPMYGDFTSVDFQAMHNAIADVDQQFHSLPARVRSRFRNDPYQVVRFVEDPANLHEAIKLGLMVPPEGYTAPVESVKPPPVQQDLVVHASAQDVLKRASIEDLAAALAAARSRSPGKGEGG